MSSPSPVPAMPRRSASTFLPVCWLPAPIRRLRNSCRTLSWRTPFGCTPDPVGAELGAALKNVIALCAGITDGLGFGDNAKAMLMTRGLTETARLGVALGAKKETFAGLAGVGDLIVTCTSMHSRNRRAGILIGQGKDPQTAMKEVGAVVEGYYAAKSAYELGKAKGIDMPITDAAYKVLYEGADVKDAVQALLSRQRKSESEDAGWQ